MDKDLSSIVAEPEESTEKEKQTIICNKITCINLHLYQLHLSPQVIMFKACAPLGRSSHLSKRSTNSKEPEWGEREREGGGKGREGGGRDRERGVRLDVHTY